MAFLKNPRFSGYRFGDDLTYNPAKLDKRYGKQLATGKLSAHALDFMKRCLCMEPAERLSIEDCLQHPYFAGLSEQVEGQARTSTSAHLRTPGAKRPFSQRSSGSVATQDEPRAEAFHAADDVMCSGLVGTPAKRQVRHLPLSLVDLCDFVAHCAGASNSLGPRKQFYVCILAANVKLLLPC